MKAFSVYRIKHKYYIKARSWRHFFWRSQKFCDSLLVEKVVGKWKMMTSGECDTYVFWTQTAALFFRCNLLSFLYYITRKICYNEAGVNVWTFRKERRDVADRGTERKILEDQEKRVKSYLLWFSNIKKYKKTVGVWMDL